MTLKDEQDIAVGIWLGTRKEKTGEQSNISMKKRNIKSLGTLFSSTLEASLLGDNWNAKVENILRVIKLWEKKRTPGLYDKAIYILAKTLLLSQFSYTLQTLFCPENTPRRINAIFFYWLLWNKNIITKKPLRK